MGVLVLGPSKWRTRFSPALPDWIPKSLPPNWEKNGRRALSPLGIRTALVGALAESGCSSTMMELHALRSGETNTGLFHRIVREFPIDRYFLYWPFGSQRAGLDVEIGFLLAKLESGAALDVRIFVENGVRTAGRLVGGDFESFELGQRTHYYEDLVAYRCRVVEWEDHESLLNAILQHGRSME